MFFVTNKPRIFNAETGVVISIYRRQTLSDVFAVDIEPADIELFRGTEQQCEDFILGMAARLGVVNPEETSKRGLDRAAEMMGEGAPIPSRSFDRGIWYSIAAIMDGSFSHYEPKDYEGSVYLVARAYDGQKYWFAYDVESDSWVVDRRMEGGE